MSECEHKFGAWYRWEYKSSGFDPMLMQWWQRIETRQARDCERCGWGQVAPMETHEAKAAAPISSFERSR